MFMGEYNHTIDPKGRLIIPAKFRDALKENFVVTKGFEHCIAIYNEEEFNELISTYSKNVSMKRDARTYQRFFIGPAVQPEFDKQGRILIPAALREYGGIGKDVVLAGVGDRIEIWDKERWSEVNSIENIEEIAEGLSEKVFMA